jgi:predicted metalloprotease
MRFGDHRTSDNVESQRGQSFGGGGRLGNGAGMLISLIGSRFGIGGVIVAVIVLALFGGLGNLTGGGQQAVAPAGQSQPGASARETCQSDEITRFSCQVLASTEERWTELLAGSGARYEAPVLVFYGGAGQSACGSADSAMGPFYCPPDRRIYLDTAFFRELERRFAAPGDFAQAYVIAHEVGHHVQTLLGTSSRIRQAQSAVRDGEANALQVRMELQADCYAGVWASREQARMEPGDLEEGMRAAGAIGDDAIQRAGRGVVVPESFTHGTSAQRQEALTRGYRGGTKAACDSYTQGI